MKHGSGFAPRDPSITPSAASKNLQNLERLANRLDARFVIPGLGIKFGWDSIIGLIPGFGDIITVGPTAYTIYQGHRMGARKRLLARMGINAAIDVIIGGIPIIGDIADLLFKANRRNIDLLRRELEPTLSNA